MKRTVEKAREVLRKVCKEFEPARDHAVTGGKELLLAIRSAIDAELRLIDKAVGAAPEVTVKVEVKGPREPVEAEPKPAGGDADEMVTDEGEPVNPS